MKRTILISLAAGVAIVPAMLGVAFASNGHGADDTRSTPSASASSTVDDRNRGADDSTTSSPTSSVPTASSTVDDRDRGRGSDDATTSAPTKSATSPATSRTSTSKATASSTVDDKGHGVEAGDDSGGHGGKSGKN